ncbi:MAG: hypothetical protein J2P54_12815 [Bradyrhizobiaceae bacterium]|nr:hypothetical protein [Bradyrhizobiaceae bacterium]
MGSRRHPTSFRRPLRLAYNDGMEHESLEYKIILEDGADSEILGKLSALDIARAAYLQAVVKYPLRNIQLRQGARTIKRHQGEPKPEPPPDPNLRSWSAHLIGGKKMTFLGFVEAATGTAAIEAAAVLFGLDDERKKRLAVNLRR